MGDWDGVVLWRGGDVAEVRERLERGADPYGRYGSRPMLHAAAECASPEVVAALAAAAYDPDELFEGQTALWRAVYAGKHHIVGVLVAAGADPWRPMMAGWSPGRLSLAGPAPFPDPPVGVALTPAETETVAVARDLNAALTGLYFEGTGLLCVAGIDAAEATRRLRGTPMTEDELLVHYDVEVDEDADPADLDDPDSWRWLEDIGDLLLVGVADVPGGCVVTQPWGYQPQTPIAGRLLSAGTVAYGVYGNPKSGNQGSIFRDGESVAGDLHPGGPPWENDPADEVLLSYLYQHEAAGYACAYAGLRLPDARPVTGPPDTWVLLPERDYWRGEP